MKILFTGGGTGGHVYPIESIYKEIEEISIEDNKYLWIGSGNSLEANIASKNNIDFESIFSGKLRRYFSLKTFVDIIKIPIGIIQSFFIIKKFQPDVIFSKGGYVSVPPAIAGWLLRKPIITHESDIVPGLANKIIMKIADKMLYGFEKTEKYLNNDIEKIYTGIPISNDILAGTYEAGHKYYKLDSNKKTILVIGGSQGAAKINNAVFEMFNKKNNDYQILHVCGQNNFEKYKKKLADYNIEDNYHLYANLTPIEMGNALAVCDLVISRAGATAITEIAASHKPAILIPLSSKGSRGDQIMNAKYFSNNKAALLIEEENLNSESLEKAAKYILTNKENYKKLSENISKISNTNAGKYIAAIISEYSLKDINFKNIKKVHLVGIGGIGVSAIARIFKKNNTEVSGSDLESSIITDDLEKEGIKINVGKDISSGIDKNLELLIYTVAAEKDNADIIKAKELGIRCLSYPQIVSMLTKDKYSICISGSHGKTTTTAMTSLMLEQGGLDPTVIVGSNVKQFDGNARIGESKYLVLEADEYKRAFLKYYPKIIILTSVEYEHPDVYRDLNDYLNTFKLYINKLKLDELLIINNDDENIVSIARNTKCKKISYAIENDADIKAQNIRYENGFPVFDLKYKDRIIRDLKLKVPGEFNIYNAMAGIAVSIYLEISDENIRKALLEYKGSWRRFELKAQNNNITIIDDYAHHPTEVKATLKAAREKYKNSRIICIYQPHQKKRTQELFNDFRNAFDDTDSTILADIYQVAGREEDIDVDSQKLAEMINDDSVKYIGNLDNIFEYLKDEIKENDVVITMGAGTITNLSDQLAEHINEKK